MRHEVILSAEHECLTWWQEKAAKWRMQDGQMDGLTTNGVLVMHPRQGFNQDSKPGLWREISVCGSVFTLRETRSSQQRGKMVGDSSAPHGSCSFIKSKELQSVISELIANTFLCFLMNNKHVRGVFFLLFYILEHLLFSFIFICPQSSSWALLVHSCVSALLFDIIQKLETKIFKSIKIKPTVLF